MLNNKSISILLVIFLSMTVVSISIAANPNAREIMQKVIDRDNGQSQYSRSVIATCRYRQKKGKISCTEKPRIKMLEGVQKDFGKNNLDSRSISIILDPAAERGIGFLQYDYDDPSKDTDQWMYLSAIGKVKRLVSGKSDQPKSGTLFGSEIAYEDVEKAHIKDYNYKLLKEENYNDRPCWVIESLPTPQRARKSNYSRSVNWIDKERYISLRSLLYDRGGRPVKQISATDLFQQDSVWIVGRLNVNNVQSRRVTTMKMKKIVINPKIDDDLLTVRTLTDGAFRERQLQLIRQRL